ncbi:MAG: response regulator [Sulfuricella sp.]|nr:response regulator [Sulfuricella sp.]
MVGSFEILNAKILVVDDQEPNVRLLERILASVGYTAVTGTTDPFAVCELHRKNRYDLILLDLLMPGMDGFQVIEGLKEIERSHRLQVIVITAQPDHERRAMEKGIRDFLSKPFGRGEVLTRIYNALYLRLSMLDEDLGAPIAMGGKSREPSARLRDSEELMRAIATGFPGGLVVFDMAESTIRYVNPAARHLLGPRVAVGAPLEGFFAAIHPLDLARVRQQSEKFPLGGIDLACRIVRPDAGVSWMQLRTFPIDNLKGETARIGAILEDLGDRKPPG